MLRSFAYAHGAAARAVGSAAAEERLGQWERGAREAFLAAYRDAVAAAPVRLVPDDAAAFQRVVAAWELDKTLYEIAYEARNRPGWLGLPLRVLAPEIPDQGSADTGGAPA
jgi:maltose alpha-D-glucosyltransferase/alpha-amylase